MAIPIPSVYFNFANTPDYFDPRLTFQRPSTATYVDKDGFIKNVPANTPRWAYNRLTGECEGVIVEPTRTNRILQSENFATTWAPANCSVTVNTVLSPDGTVDADTLTATSTTAYITQNVVITAGNGTTFSVFAKPNNVNFCRLRITDSLGHNVQTWFNVLDGTVGSNTVGSTTCAFQSAYIQPHIDGWFRCVLTATTQTIVSTSYAIYPAPSDGSGPAATDSIHIWGAQVESQNNSTNNAVTSYIPTTTSTATRNADNITMAISPTTDKWFNVREGTIAFEMVTLDEPSGNAVYGGIGNTFTDTAYFWRTASSSMAFSVGSSSGGTSTQTKNLDLREGNRHKVAGAWSSTVVFFAANGTTPSSTAVTLAVPVSTIRFGIGTTPYSASATTSLAHANIRSFTYYPKCLDAVDLMTITA